LTAESGTYQFIYQATDGPCVGQDTVEVVIWGLPEVEAGEDQFVFLEEPSELGGDPTTDFDFSVEWSLGDLLNDSTAFNPMTIGLNITTQFTVTVTDLNGCMSSDSVLVNIIPEIGVPTGFTPNGDGQNDLWEISNVGFYNNTVVEIYNRWGDMLYRSEGVFQPWDGTYEQSMLPIGTYYYVININEPEFPDPLTGPVTIIR
jgi:gliding motility-associated-like protein